MKITINDTEHTINCVEVDGARWYKAKDVANVLGYKDTKSTIRAHVIIDNKRQLKELKPQEQLDYNQAISIYINEAGLRALVVKSQLPNASEVAKLLGINEETRYIRKERDH